MAENIASVFAQSLLEKKQADEVVKIGVGNDSRVSCDELKQAVINGLSQENCKVYDCGLTSTPSMYMATIMKEFNYDGAIMITASHLPANRNGLKFFTKRGGLEKEDIRKILEKAAEKSDVFSEKGKAEKVNLRERYVEYLKEIIRSEVNATDYNYPLRGMHIVIDASNGVGGFFQDVLEPLGASTKGSICMNPDGTFPVHVPNPENKEAMDALRNTVIKEKADLGVIFDTDGDRAAVVLSNGDEINKNALIALMAAIVSKEHPNTTVVTDSVASDYLTEFLEKELLMHHHRYKRGYKNVINEAIRLNSIGIETHLAIETSGHAALKENYFLDDGAYLSVRIICCLAKCIMEKIDLKDMIKNLKKPAESKEYRIKILRNDYKEYGEKMLNEFREYAKADARFHIVKPNYEGIRIKFLDDEVEGWMLLRMSLHDPVISINIETKQKGGTDIVIERIAPFLKRFPDLNKDTN